MLKTLLSVIRAVIVELVNNCSGKSAPPWGESG